MSGKVYLVGAGPGDPELLTMKAARVLREADMVLHDDLVSEEILGLIPTHVQLRNVGKRSGEKSVTQAGINALMISLAHTGLQVVRLKSGDPLIFGRIGEEIAALQRAGTEFEIIPGITSALGAAAALRTPLTDRSSAHAVTLVTGHLADPREQFDWTALIASGSTLAVYMPGHDYAVIARRLLSSGMQPHTPCAIVSHATTPQEQHYWTEVTHLADAPRLPAPALLLVGKALGLAAQDREIAAIVPSEVFIHAEQPSQETA